MHTDTRITNSHSHSLRKITMYLKYNEVAKLWLLRQMSLLQVFQRTLTNSLLDGTSGHLSASLLPQGRRKYKTS